MTSATPTLRSPGDTTIRIELFGTLTVVAGTSEVDVRGDRLRRLLARLALGKGRAVLRSTLADAVWGDSDPPDDPDPSLRTYVNRLRSALSDHHVAERIETTDGGYALAPPFELDIADFDDAVGQARRARDTGDLVGALATFDRCLGLYRGRLLQVWADEPWVRAHASRFEEMVLAVREERATCAIDLGHLHEAIEQLRTVNENEPHRESTVRALARALHLDGRSGEALDELAAHRKRLRTDLGLDPGPELARLEAQILEHDPALSTSESFASSGRALRGYRLQEEIGTGSFSTVYRAVQPSVDREVAIKVIREELANRPGFIRRFEFEAQLVARLEHPHIVPLYDFWREPDRAFLVMRLLPGGSVAQSVEQGPWSMARVLNLVREVGDALEVAHRRGVVHRDLKPANILLDDRGAAFLSDFGIATTRDTPDGDGGVVSIGSPAYAAPEQLRHEPVGPEADVYSFAVLVHEVLTGTRPTQLPDGRWRFADAAEDLVSVLEKAMAPEPADRHRSIALLVSELEAAVGGPLDAAVDDGARTRLPGEPSDSPVAENPYRGLETFTEADRAVFFGREELVGDLVERISSPRAGRLIVLVGPSGSGKSSLVHAGVLAQLRDDADEGSVARLLVSMTPGDEPFVAITQALSSVATDAASDLGAIIHRDEAGLSRAVAAIAGDTAEIVLFIDQLEELFRLPDTTVRAFLDRLTRAIEDASCPLRVVTTIRADQFDRPLAFTEFGHLVPAATVPIPPLRADGIERVIVGPAAAAGVDVEPALVATLVAEAADREAALPLLEFVLTEMYDAMVEAGERTLTLDDYERVGGIAGALAARAESLYTDNEPAERDGLRSLFAQLVTVQEPEAVARRRARLADVLAVPGVDEDALERLAASRLLSFGHEPDTREPTVEVSHEALFAQWDRLAGWIEVDRAALVAHEELASATRRWIDDGQDNATLLRGGRLVAAEELAAERPDLLLPAEAAFVAASIELRDRDARQAAAQLEAERRAARRLRGVLAAVAVIAVLAVVAGLVAFDQRRRADQQARDATAAQVVADEAAAQAAAEAERADEARATAEAITLRSRAEALAVERPTEALLLAAAAYRQSGSVASQGTLLRVLESSAGVVRRVELPSVPVTRCEDTLWPADGYDWPTNDGWAVYAQGDAVNIVDPQNGQVREHTVRPDPCARVLLSWPDGPILFHTAAGILLESEPGADLVPLIDPGPVAVSLAAARGDRPVAGIVAGQMHLFEVDGRVIASPVDSEISFWDLWFAPAGDVVLGIARSDNRLNPAPVQLIDTRNGEPRWTTELDSQPFQAAWSPNVERVAVTTGNGDVAVLAVADGSVVETVRSARGRTDSVTFVDDQTIATASAGMVEIHRLGEGPDPRTFAVSGARHIRSLGGGRLVVHTSLNDQMTIIELDGQGTATARQPVAAGEQVVVTPAGLAVAVDLATQSARLIDVGAGTSAPLTVPAASSAPTAAAIPLDEEGDELVVLGSDGTVARASAGVIQNELAAPDGEWILGGGDGEGERLALLLYNRDGARAHATLLDPRSLEVIVTATMDDLPCTCQGGVYPAPDGNSLVFDAHGELRRFDPSGGTVDAIPVPEASHFEYSGDSDTGLLYRGTDRGELGVVDFATGTYRTIDSFGGGISALQVVPGSRLVVQTEAGAVWLLDLESQERIGRLWRGGAGNSIPPALSEDGRTVWTGSETEIVGLSLEPEQWLARACELAGRDITAEEWEELVPGEQDHQPVCGS